MQLCESCGACRETDWRLCPFCRAPLTTTDIATACDNDQFDALAAVSETSELEVLPSLIPQDETTDAAIDETDLLTAQDLAHLTGDGGPSVNRWESPTEQRGPSPVKTDGIDAPVSKAVVFPLVAVALVAVAFVAYSILTTPSPDRPDAVALIDRTTTTIATTTTTAASNGPGPIGIDLAEQAEWLCAGDQFSIARAEAPSLAIYNDLLTVTKDGRDDWVALPEHETLRTPVPALIGCLTTADGGEIDRCPTSGHIISRRSVDWSYRLLQSSNGALLGSDQGTARDVRPCDALLAESGGVDSASWSPLPQAAFDRVAEQYTGAPHPQAACPDPAEKIREVFELAPFAQGASIHATADGFTDDDVALPAGWRATDDRPVEVVLCLEAIDGKSTLDVPGSEDAPASEGGSETAEACRGSVRVHAMDRGGRYFGSWDYVRPTCAAVGEDVTPPDNWWTTAIGPSLGYAVDASETEGS